MLSDLFAGLWNAPTPYKTAELADMGYQKIYALLTSSVKDERMPSIGSGQKDGALVALAQYLALQVQSQKMTAAIADDIWVVFCSSDLNEWSEIARGVPGHAGMNEAQANKWYSWFSALTGQQENTKTRPVEILSETVEQTAQDTATAGKGAAAIAGIGLTYLAWRAYKGNK